MKIKNFINNSTSFVMKQRVGVEIGLLLLGYNIKNLIRKEQEMKAA